jgi:DNA invertase Pin-like site-specific DNA recombinase
MLSTARLNLAYTRKSLKDKTYNTIERDIARFKELGFQEGEIYHDIESGDSDARFNFAEIWSLVLAGKVASLTITRDDRLGRKGSSLLRLYKDMETHGTKLIVLDDGGEVDFTNPYEWIRRADSAIRSEYERRALKSRIEKGINYRRASGKSSGGRAPFGYFRDKKKDILIDESLRDTVRRIVEITLESGNLYQSCEQIKAELGLDWKPPQLRYYLHCAPLRGHCGWNTSQMVHDISDSPIYSRMLFNICPNNRVMSEREYSQYKELMDSNKKAWGQAKKGDFYSLRGLCYCAFCEEKLSYSNNNGWLQVKHTSKSSSRKPECRYIARAEVIESNVINELVNQAEKISDKIIKLNPVEVLPESTEISQIRQQIETLKNMKLPSLDATIETLEARLESLLIVDVNGEDLQREFVQAFKNFKFWNLLSPQEKHFFYKRFIKRVYIEKADLETKIEVRFRF